MCVKTKRFNKTKYKFAEKLFCGEKKVCLRIVNILDWFEGLKNTNLIRKVFRKANVLEVDGRFQENQMIRRKTAGFSEERF